MKRILAAIVLLSILTGLFGCGSSNGLGQNEANFYYSRISYAYGTQEGVVTPEQRDIAGHAGDLNYLLALYLMGPLDETLTSPFPSRTKLISAQLDEDTLTVELTSVDKFLTDAEFSLACACLTMTCMELCDATQVTILSGVRTVTMGTDDLLLYDDTIPEETLLEEAQ